MKATITNLGAVAIPLTSADGAGIVAQIEPGAHFVLDDREISVVTAGDNPSFQEDLTQALGQLYALAVKLITFWKAHPQPQGATQAPLISIGIVADKSNGIRVTGDDKALDQEIPPGGSIDVTMKNYVELRMLGLANDPQAGPEAP